MGRYGIVKNDSDFSAYTPERISDVWGELYEKHIGRIDSTLSRGYQREVKVLLTPEFPDRGVPLTRAVKEESNKRVEGHLKDFSRYLFKIK